MINIVSQVVLCEGCVLVLRGEWVIFTVRPGDLAPDDADLGSTDLLLGAVDESDLLAEVEAAMPRVSI